MDNSHGEFFIGFIYSKCHLCVVTLSAASYIIWILFAAKYDHIGWIVYWWFIVESILLLFTANFGITKNFCAILPFGSKCYPLLLV